MKAALISSRRAETGSDSGKVIARGDTEEAKGKPSSQSG